MNGKISRLFVVAAFCLSAGSPARGFVELSGNYGFDSNRYGDDGYNRITDETYTAGMALYFLSMTALEFHYSRSDKTSKEILPSRSDDSTGDYFLSESKNEVLTSVYGASIKQVFTLGRRGFLKPSVSLGYAKFIVTDKTGYTLKDDAGQEISVVGTPRKRREDALYANLALGIRLTSRLSLQGSVQMVMPDFDLGRFDDNMKYLVGFGISLF